MNWIKTYESFINESPLAESIDDFEKLIGIPTGSGIITSVEYDKEKKTLVVNLVPKIGSFDTGSLMNAIDRSRNKIKTKYPGIKIITAGLASINV